MTVVVTGGPLTRSDVVAVARGTSARLGDAVAERMAPARRLVDDAIADDRTIYGITTGFGALATTHVDPADSDELQLALIRSHAAGVGAPLPPEFVRAMLLLRARTLAQGHSGVRPVIPARLLELLESDLLPVVPDRGSVGASGDLAAFAHLALPLIGEGWLSEHGGAPEPAAEVLARHGLEPIRLRAKEGLSLLNGTEGMLVHGVLGLGVAENLVATADLACAMSIEALLGSLRPFDERVHALRAHPGQLASAAALRRHLRGSQIGASHAEDFTHAVQDAYSLRCAPQVHGAVRDTLDHAGRVFDVELGAVVDNPIVFPAEGDVVSAGNFHGQPLAFAMDFMAMAATELGSISERRVDRILDPHRSFGLPAFLAARPGLHSGYMLAQYTAAALVAENRVLSHPASVESIPTSGLQEDHVSMGWGAGRKLHQVLDGTAKVLAIELLCAAQGVEYRIELLGGLQPSPAVRAAVDLIRRIVPPLEADRPIGAEIEVVAEVVRAGSLLDVVQGA